MVNNDIRPVEPTCSSNHVLRGYDRLFTGRGQPVLVVTSMGLREWAD